MTTDGFSRSENGQVGILFFIVWLVVLFSRCCAPCCCTMPDVECPCPCKAFHLLDVPFYLGMVLALYAVSFFFSVDSMLQNGDFNEILVDEGLHQFMDMVQLLGVLLLLAAVPLGVMKYRKMQTSSYAAQPVPAVVVGTAVAVGNEASAA